MRKQTLFTLTLATAAGLFYARAKRAEAALLPDDKPMSPEMKRAISNLREEIKRREIEGWEPEPTPPKMNAGINHVDLLRNKDGSFKVRLFTAGGLLKVAAFRIEADKVQGAPCKCADLEKLRVLLAPAVKNIVSRDSPIGRTQPKYRELVVLEDALLDAAQVLGIEGVSVDGL